VILESLDNPSAEPARVLLMFDPAPADVDALGREVAALAAGRADHEVRIESLSGVSAVGGCSVICGVGDSDRGVHRVDAGRLAFSCVLTPSGWRRVVDLLEPFLADAKESRFQFLSEHGPVTWIISTERGW
jgi:hypothetical protein